MGNFQREFVFYLWLLGGYRWGGPYPQRALITMDMVSRQKPKHFTQKVLSHVHQVKATLSPGEEGLNLAEVPEIVIRIISHLFNGIYCRSRSSKHAEVEVVRILKSPPYKNLHSNRLPGQNHPSRVGYFLQNSRIFVKRSS